MKIILQINDSTTSAMLMIFATLRLKNQGTKFFPRTFFGYSSRHNSFNENRRFARSSGVPPHFTPMDSNIFFNLSGFISFNSSTEEQLLRSNTNSFSPDVESTLFSCLLIVSSVVCCSPRGLFRAGAVTSSAVAVASAASFGLELSPPFDTSFSPLLSASSPSSTFPSNSQAPTHPSLASNANCGPTLTSNTSFKFKLTAG
mmetsp:Transcript_16390/g.28035  ORF Transcript_16390/g.28035 Transcript_16390/m.28035 type:complete len:201 (+) Transcript_16390:30-632(+)